jgi:glycosyltransferase involved in cell wall biosynthesis
VRISHLSRARTAADGGVATAVAELLCHQQAAPSEASNALASQSLDLAWFTPEPPGSMAAKVRRFAPQLLHVHGLWRAPNRLACRLQGHLPVVVAPHGMLDPWAFAQHHRRKSLLWWMYEHRCLQRAAALQALCPAEAQALRRLGLTTPIALIPNGVAMPATMPADFGSRPASLPKPCWSGTIPKGEQVLLFLGRFHHKKGIQPLLEAWQCVASEAARGGWWLALVGYGDGGALQRQLSASPIPRVVTCGPVFNAEKQAVLAGASAFVLPSYSEGLPMAALEAMAHQLPCLLSAACNLPEARAAGATLPAEPSVSSLSAALQQLFSLSPCDRSAMGAAGQALVREQFSWTVVAAQTLSLYRWILGEGERPAFVDLN